MMQQVINATHKFFNSLAPADFAKTILEKWTEHMEECISNRKHYFEKQPAMVFESDAG